MIYFWPKGYRMNTQPETTTENDILNQKRTERCDWKVRTHYYVYLVMSCSIVFTTYVTMPCLRYATSRLGCTGTGDNTGTAWKRIGGVSNS